MSTSEKRTTVYPGDTAAAILGGHSSTAFNLALKCWARLLAKASVNATEVLSLEEWACLADALHLYTIEPLGEDPGETIAEVLQAKHDIEALGHRHFKKDPEQRIDALARKMKGMDYVQAWSIVHACMFHSQNHGSIAKGDAWWTVTYRKERAQ